jgi:RHS repeat-associated protein
MGCLKLHNEYSSNLRIAFSEYELLPKKHVKNTCNALQWKYNGKELNEELGLDWYDYGARNYDASLGRWFGIDELAEKHFNFSPYTYTANNPVLFVDFDGNDYGVLVKRGSGGNQGTITIKATYISNSNNARALQRGVDSHNSRSGKAVFVAGGVKALRSGGRSADAYTVNYDLSTQVDNTMESPYTSGGDRQVRNDQTGTLNSFDTVSEFPRNENQSGGTGNDEITVTERSKNSSTTNHEIGHSLGNEHTSEGGTLPNHGTNTGISATAETLMGVGIGGDTSGRNSANTVGDGTLLNGSTNQGLENGQVISVNRYNRIVRRVERREQRRLEREQRGQ